jgi:phthalate 4,5-cis-dihydrodiol dehydrogenase
MLPANDDRRRQSPELIELSDVLARGRPILQDGRWGLVTLQVCLAIMQSANEHREITLRHQVAVPAGF